MTRLDWPEDTASLSAAVLGAGALFAWRYRSQLARVPSRLWLIALAAASVLLSAAYVETVLGGGPRIIDATSYYLQARTFASGQLGYAPPEPVAAHFGRFLLALPDGRLTTLFPPGYPALLALGFLVGAPLWVGPLTAGGITLATYWLAQRYFRDGRVALLAALASTLCAALRYHTADTMAHGLCALLVALCLGSVVDGSWRSVALGGLLLGALFATRPVTGLVVFAVMLWVLWQRRHPPRERLRLLAALGTASVGILVFLAEQRAVTGEWFGSSQYRYYQLADAPLGCFRFGFGEGIGCRGEHGDFVSAYLPEGYGFAEALGTTVRRLAQHLADAGNLELFALPLLAAPWVGRHEPRMRWLGAALLLQVLLYAGFYFDGNFPGGGARMFADVLPVEHVLIAWLLVRVRLAPLLAPLMLFGFAFHTASDHRALSARDGGAPMFEPERMEGKLPPNALLFVGTDHGYNLAFDPSGGSRSYNVVRHKGDALDYLSWVQAGKPPAYRYVFDPGASPARPHLVPHTPEPSLRFEFENQWPLVEGDVRGVRRGKGPDARDGDGLWLGPGEALFALWVPDGGRHRLVLAARGEVELSAQGERIEPLRELGGARVAAVEAARAGELRVRARVGPGGAFLDWVELWAEPTPAAAAHPGSHGAAPNPL